jgi:hypothetical protein
LFCCCILIPITFAKNGCFLSSIAAAVKGQILSLWDQLKKEAQMIMQ